MEAVKSTPPAPTKRRSREQRRAQILQESIAFFAEHGFSGSTHELARQIGVTQPLLFRYFDSKEELFDATFEAVFSEQWQDEWPRLLKDRSRPMGQRLIDFYDSYLKVAFNRDWMRLYVYAGLADVEINRRYFDIVEREIILPICNELRAEFKMPTAETLPITDDELDYVWSFHGGIFYHGIRRCAFGTSLDHTLSPTMLKASISAFVAGAPHAIIQFLAASTPTDQALDQQHSKPRPTSGECP